MPAFKSPSKPLPQEVTRLGWISFFTDVASEMIYPVVPLFLTSALGAPMTVLGMIEGIAEAIVSIMKGLSGWHSDALGRRIPYIRWGYGLSALAKPFMALAFSWPFLFAARTMDRIGKGVRTSARDALIADAVGPEQGGQAYGYHRMMDTAGAMLGVLLATALLWLLPNQYRTIFLLAAVPGMAAIWLTFKLHEAKPMHETGNKAALLQLSSRPWADLPGTYWLPLGLLMVFAFANSSDTLLIMRAKSLGLSDAQAVLAYLLFNIVYAASAYPLGILSDRWGRWRMIIAGWTLYGFVYLGFALANVQAIWWLFPFYGLFMGLTDGIGRALIRDHIPDGKKGIALGIFHMGTGIMSLAGSVTAGMCWDMIGPQAPFVLGGCTALIAAGAAWHFTTRKSPVQPRP